MKSKVKPRKEPELVTYPCLRIGANGLVVLFIHQDTGMVVGGDQFRIGEYSTEWRFDSFASYEGSVELLS